MIPLRAVTQRPLETAKAVDPTDQRLTPTDPDITLSSLLSGQKGWWESGKFAFAPLPRPQPPVRTRSPLHPVWGTGAVIHPSPSAQPAYPNRLQDVQAGSKRQAPAPSLNIAWCGGAVSGPGNSDIG